MKLTLERAELIQLIGSTLGYKLADEDVSVNADPLEVRIQNVNLEGMAKIKSTTPDTMSDDVVEDEEEDEPTEEEQTATNILTMADIMKTNTQMGGAGAPTDSLVGSPPLRRPLGPLEYEDPPPLTDAELEATRK